MGDFNFTCSPADKTSPMVTRDSTAEMLIDMLQDPFMEDTAHARASPLETASPSLAFNGRPSRD